MENIICGFTPGRCCPGTSRALIHYFPSFPKTWPPRSGLGLRHEMKVGLYHIPGKPNLPGHRSA